jgi:hypothetical protein
MLYRQTDRQTDRQKGKKGQTNKQTKKGRYILRVPLIKVVLGCGGSAAENCTYLVQASTLTTTTSSCTYTICPCSSNICRIRLDFSVSCKYSFYRLVKVRLG